MQWIWYKNYGFGMCNMSDQTCQLLHSNYCLVIDMSTTSTSCLLSCVKVKKDLLMMIIIGTFLRCNKNVHRVPILRQYIANVITVYASLYLDPEARWVQRCEVFFWGKSDVPHHGAVAWGEGCPDHLGIHGFHVQSLMITWSDFEWF